MHAACCRDDPVRCRVPREVRPCRLPETATYPLSYLPIKQGPTVVQGPSERPGGRGEFESRVGGPLGRHLRSAYPHRTNGERPGNKLPASHTLFVSLRGSSPQSGDIQIAFLRVPGLC